MCLSDSASALIPLSLPMCPPPPPPSEGGRREWRRYVRTLRLFRNTGAYRDTSLAECVLFLLTSTMHNQLLSLLVLPLFFYSLSFFLPHQLYRCFVVQHTQAYSSFSQVSFLFVCPPSSCLTSSLSFVRSVSLCSVFLLHCRLFPLSFLVAPFHACFLVCVCVCVSFSFPPAPCYLTSKGYGRITPRVVTMAAVVQQHTLFAAAAVLSSTLASRVLLCCFFSLTQGRNGAPSLCVSLAVYLCLWLDFASPLFPVRFSCFFFFFRAREWHTSPLRRQTTPAYSHTCTSPCCFSLRFPTTTMPFFFVKNTPLMLLFSSVMLASFMLLLSLACSSLAYVAVIFCVCVCVYLSVSLF